MRLAVVVVLALMLAGCASARPNLRDPWHATAIAVAVPDVATTYYGLEQSGIAEANPAAKSVCGEAMNVGCMIAIKAGTISFLAYIENELKLEGWGKRILWMLPIGLWGGAAAWNATLVW